MSDNDKRREREHAEAAVRLIILGGDLRRAARETCAKHPDLTRELRHALDAYEHELKAQYAASIARVRAEVYGE